MQGILNTQEQIVLSKLEQVKDASRQIIRCPEEEINAILNEVADEIIKRQDELLEANGQDLNRMDPEDPRYDRLLLDADRLKDIASNMRHVADLPSPLGRIIEQRRLQNKLLLTKVKVPIGVIGIIYEARPNVTFDVIALCLKSGNASVLKGGSAARESNSKAVEIIKRVLHRHGLKNAVYLSPHEREVLPIILNAADHIDLIIPRGGEDLINFVRENARVPVIETGAGIVHVYFDEEADTNKGKQIITNAKARRVSVCNALDTLIIHRSRIEDLPELLFDLGTAHRAEVYADTDAHRALQGNYPSEHLLEATEENFGTEFLSMRLAIKTVGSPEEAIEHISRHSSKHSESIITENRQTADRFLHEVDAAVVYHNASTTFTDGAQFGLGAEIGISTQKLHARGPMALEELTSYKWRVEGDGQVRP